MADFDYRKFLKENKSTFFSSLTEGQFSWMTHDTDNQIGSEPENTITVYMHDDKGNTWREDNYEGYGDFGGKDYYELVAEMNGYTKDDAYEFGGTLKDLRGIGINLAFNDLKPKNGGPVLFPALTEKPGYPSGHDFTEEAKNDPNQSWYNREDDDYNAWEDEDEDDLYEAQEGGLDVASIAQQVADEFTKSDELDLKYVITPGSIEDTPAGPRKGAGFDLDVEAGPNTPGEDWKDENGFGIENYLGHFAGGSFTITPEGDGYVVRNAAMKNAVVGYVTPEGELDFVRDQEQHYDDIMSAEEKANVFVREEKADMPKINIPAIASKIENNPKIDVIAAKVQNDPKAMDALNKLASMYGLDQMNELDSSDFSSIEMAAKEFASTLQEMDDNDDASLTAAGVLGGPLLLAIPGVMEFIQQTVQSTDVATSDSLIFLASIVAGVVIGNILDRIKNANESVSESKDKKSNKMKKSELKEMIKAAMLAEYEKDVNITDENPENEEDFLAETQNPEVLAMVELIMDALGPERFLDELISAMDTSEAKANLEHIIQMWDLDGGLYEAKDEEVDVEADAEETETDSEETTDVAADNEETIDTETTAEINPDTKVVQDALTQAMEAAKKLGDKKLESQIGNTITFFTRAHIAGTELDAVAENTKEYYKDAEADDAEHINALEKDMADDKENSLKIGEVMFPMWTKLKNK